MNLRARTSLTHPLQIAAIPLPAGGVLGVTFCPGKKGDSLHGAPWDRDLRAGSAGSPASTGWCARPGARIPPVPSRHIR